MLDLDNFMFVLQQYTFMKARLSEIYSLRFLTLDEYKASKVLWAGLYLHSPVGSTFMQHTAYITIHHVGTSKGGMMPVDKRSS